MLNNLEKDILQSILNNEPLLNAVKAVFDETIDKEKPEIREGQSNELLGEKYRSYKTSKELIDKSFVNLLSYKVEKNPIKGFNKAR